MSEVSTLVESVRQDVAALNASVASGNTALSERLSGLILEQKSRIDALETAAARSASADSRSEQRDISAHRKAFKSYIRTGNDAELRTVGVVATPAVGGLTVPGEVDTNITKLLVELSDLRPYANVVTISGATSSWEHNVDLSTAAGGWVGESGTRSKTDVPSVGRISITPGELYARPETSLQLIEDSMFDIESWYASSVAETLALLEGVAFFSGNGTNKPTGLLTYSQNSLGTSLAASGTPDYTKIQTITCETALTITVADVNALVHSVKPQVRKAGKFYCSRGILQKLGALKDSTGRPLWMPSLAAGVPGTLAGYPVVEMADMPSTTVGVGTVPTTPLALAFGDMKRAYTIVDKAVSTTTKRDDITNPGFVNFYTRRRVGGGLVDGTSLVFLKIKQS
jgi:HK97 family phage major capsid protein